MTEAKFTKPIVFYDIETTGLDFVKDRITEFYGKKIYPDGSIHELHCLINPEIEIPLKIQELTGITNEKVANCPVFENVMSEIYNFLTDDMPDLCGYGTNVFDNSFVAEKYSPFDWIFPFPEQRLFDIADVYRKLNPRTLSDAVLKYTGKPHDSAHSADGDVKACVDVLHGMFEVHSELIGKNIDSAIEYVSDTFKIVDVSRKLTINDKGQIVFNFGKSKGVPVLDDIGYADWMLRQSWITPNTRYFLEKELGILEQKEKNKPTDLPF